MANAMYLGVASMGRTVELPTSRGRFAISGLAALSRQSLPSDPIGNLTLTLDNIAIGSSVQIETQSGITLVNRTAAATTELFSLVVYAPGSPLNSLRIKVRKGSSAPFYRPFETLTTATVGSQSIYVAQQQDD